MIYQIIALLIWSSSFITAKYAGQTLDVAWLVQMRLIVAAGIMLPFAVRYFKTIPLSSWKYLIILSFFHYVVVLMLQFTGVQYTSAASAVTLIGLEPLLMVMIGHLFFGDRARWFHWVFGLVAFIGVVLLVSDSPEQEEQASLFGSLLVLLGDVVFCAVWRPTRRLINQIGANAYTALSMPLGAILCLPITLLLAKPESLHWTWPSGISVLYLGVMCSCLAYWLWNKGMSHVSANLSGLLTTLEPVFGVLLAVVLLDERLHWNAGLGITLIIFATTSAGLLPRWLKSL